MKITHIMYRTNLNYKTAREIIDYLIRYGMINESCIDERTYYSTTEKGNMYVRAFEEFFNEFNF